MGLAGTEGDTSGTVVAGVVVSVVPGAVVVVPGSVVAGLEGVVVVVVGVVVVVLYVAARKWQVGC